MVKIGVVEFGVEDISDLIKYGLSFLNFIPKNKKNKIGIIFSIQTENNKEKLRVENDLIRDFTTYLNNTRNGQNFYVYKFPQNICQKIRDNKSALKYLFRSKGHLIIFGSISERNIQGQNNYILKLRGVVRHAEIPDNIKQVVLKEFSGLIPGKLTFSEDEEVLGFELTSQWFVYVTRYIIGIAARISWDLNLAKNLFEELYEEVSNITDGNRIPVIYEIKKRIPFRIIEILDLLVSINYEHYISSREQKYILISNELVDKILKIDSQNYRAKLVKSICLFFNDKIDDAIAILLTINNTQDVTWRYNLGFLYAYKGDASLALENYKKIRYYPAALNVCNDSEAFMTDVLQSKPNLIQLYFFRGLLNYKIKADYELAREDFSIFLDSIEPNKFTELVILAKKYLNEIDSSLGVIKE